MIMVSSFLRILKLTENTKCGTQNVVMQQLHNMITIH